MFCSFKSQMMFVQSVLIVIASMTSRAKTEKEGGRVVDIMVAHLLVLEHI